MASAPQDLKDLRAGTMLACGFTDPNEVGIAADDRHREGGGYHCGRTDLAAIGKLGTDYSARLARDRAGLTDDASAMDIGDDWPRGGRPAWLRFNNLLVRLLHAGDPALDSIRAVNYSPDGTSRKRTDREHGWAVETSTDNVDIHTHIEWYRNTAGRRHASVQRLLEIVVAAINNTKLEDTVQLDEWFSKYGEAEAWRTEALINNRPAVGGGPLKGEENQLHTALSALAADVAAVKATAQSGGVDPHTVAELVVEQLGPLLPTLADIEKIVDARVRAALNGTHLTV